MYVCASEYYVYIMCMYVCVYVCVCCAYVWCVCLSMSVYSMYLSV